MEAEERVERTSRLVVFTGSIYLMKFLDTGWRLT